LTRIILFSLAQAAAQPLQAPAGALTGFVRDSVGSAPVAGVAVRVSREGVLIAAASTGANGAYTVRGLASGSYTVSVSRIGYRPASRTLRVPRGDGDDPVFILAPVVARLAAVNITAGSPVAVEMKTGDQTFQQSSYHGSPTTTTSQIVQQAIAGAAHAPTGEVHIRGQHAEYTYYVDGIPVPSSIGGTLNELFDPAIIDKIGFQTGGWDAEYGNKNIAVVDVTTKIPASGLHYQVSGYSGSFNSDGQALVVSDQAGSAGVLLSLTRQETSMRREPLQAGVNGAPINFHNAGQDQYGFGKAGARLSPRDSLTLDFSASRTHAGIPYDSSFGILDDHQTDVNGFANLGWRHRFGESSVAGAETGSPELFSAIYVRRSTLDYLPGSVDQPQFIFYPDTTGRFSVQEHRIATTMGVKVDFTEPLTRSLTWKSGAELSLVEGREDFNTVDARGMAGPSVNTNVRGGDAGAYTQIAFEPTSRWQIRAGLRLDHHVAPVAGDMHQVSPRVRINWFASPLTTVWLYYGRLFIPSNVEDFHVLAAVAQGDTVGLPTVPERDHYFEAGVVHKAAGGIVTKLVAYYRNNSPAIDDNTLPGTALVATVNVARVHVTGIETVLEIHPEGELSGYVNAALSHATAHGPVTGGFFPTPYPTGWFDQDHDQRLSIVASGNYSPHWGYLSLTGVFGSGLSNGHPDAAPNGTGLFDFNPAVKTAPSFVVNAGIGARWTAGNTTVRPELSVDNVFDHRYILKGAFTSGPSVGRPRSISLRVTLAH
jgi:hypothetical protein